MDSFLDYFVEGIASIKVIDAELMTLLTIPDPVILDLSNEIFLPVQALIKRIRTSVKSYVGDGVTGHLA